MPPNNYRARSRYSIQLYLFLSNGIICSRDIHRHFRSITCYAIQTIVPKLSQLIIHPLLLLVDAINASVKSSVNKKRL
jgi:hypothetical protein